jgi:hypothetical protein
MVNLLTMKERIARCTRMVVDKTHPALTQSTSLFSESLKKRSGNSVLDSNGLRVFDKNDKDEEVLFFFCLVDKCATDDCTGKKIKITRTSTNHAASHLKGHGILSTKTASANKNLPLSVASGQCFIRYEAWVRGPGM